MPIRNRDVAIPFVGAGLVPAQYARAVVTGMSYTSNIGACFYEIHISLKIRDDSCLFEGFKAIADKYSNTPAGNSAKYYAGLCYLRLGDFDNAIAYLEDFDGEGELLPIMKYGLLGDCYSEKKEYDKALDNYKKATTAGENDVLVSYYLKKLGMLNEYQGNKDAAKEAYERLHRDFPNQSSSDWRDIEKYIYRAGGGQ
jgi:tetratricopeptide (TPR) repeat protein